MANTVLTYTRNDLEYIKSKGCDDGWVLNENRAGSCEYLVCCHSQGAKQRSAFLVGLISRIRPIEEKRWAIHISKYASIDVPDVWKGWQNPVHYTTLEELGIESSILKFKKIEQKEKTEIKEIPSLSIEQAKEGISKKFNISPEQIEIVIKG
ncbi:MAG: hypothetical protein WBG70_12925 [Spirulinaceae cyanobacterium]